MYIKYIIIRIGDEGQRLKTHSCILSKLVFIMQSSFFKTTSTSIKAARPLQKPLPQEKRNARRSAEEEEEEEDDENASFVYEDGTFDADEQEEEEEVEEEKRRQQQHDAFIVRGEAAASITRYSTTKIRLFFKEIVMKSNYSLFLLIS
jgi:hypothetical protein